MSQKVKNVLTILLVYTGSITGALLLSQLTGSFYSDFFNLSCDNSFFIAFNFDRDCRLEGFIYSYSFLLPLFSFILLKEKIAWFNYFFGIVVFIILSILIGYYKGIVIYLLMLLSGWLLAKGGRAVYERIKK